MGHAKCARFQFRAMRWIARKINEMKDAFISRLTYMQLEMNCRPHDPIFTIYSSRVLLTTQHLWRICRIQL